jgi:hypothetical protein
MAVKTWTTFGDPEKISHSLNKRLDEVIGKNASGTASKGKAEELLQRLAVSVVLGSGNCRWIAEEDEKLVQSTGVAWIKEKRVFFQEASVAEYFSAIAVVNRLYAQKFAPPAAARLVEIDGPALGRIMFEERFLRVRSYLDWKIGHISFIKKISTEAKGWFKNLDKIQLADKIREEELLHLWNMLSEAGIKIKVKDKNSPQKKGFWGSVLSVIGLKK